MTLGEKIYIIRRNHSKELSHEKLSQAINVSKTSLIKWEQNKTKPSVENLLKICNYFEMDFHYFIQEIANFTFYIDKYENYHKQTNVKTPLNENLKSNDLFQSLVNNHKIISNLIHQQNFLISKIIDQK